LYFYNIVCITCQGQIFVSRGPKVGDRKRNEVQKNPSKGSEDEVSQNFFRRV